MEKEICVEPYGVIRICDVCKVGEMIPNGKNTFVNGPNIGHECSKCKNINYFNERYPSIRYRVKK